MRWRRFAPWARATLPEASFAKRALDGGGDTVARELALVAEEPDDPVEIGFALLDGKCVADVGMKEDAPRLVDQAGIAERHPDFIGHLFDPAVLPHQGQRFLGSDAFDAVVEVGAD